MGLAHETIETGGEVPAATVMVWDPFVRVFHWTLLTFFVIAFVTGDDFEDVHQAAGYGIAILLMLRLVWGVIGPRNARFSSFVRSPRDVLVYLRDFAGLKASRHLGHNPAGSAMIGLLLAALIGTAVTGYVMATVAYGETRWVEKLHEALAHGTLILAGLHVLGVVAASLLHHENLVKAMWTGRKRVL